MDNQIKHQGSQIFTKTFAESLAGVLTAKLGLPWQLRILDSPNPVESEGRSIHFRLSVNGALRGECFVELNEVQAAQLGSKILGQPDSAFNDEHVEALASVLSPALEGLRTVLFEGCGDLTLSVTRVEDLVFGGMSVVPLAASCGNQDELSLLLYFDGRLMTALASMLPKAASESEKAVMESANLDLVMDVELNVSLRFGQCKLPLREVLDLASGSVIELDRDVDDPVELLLDGKVIARGEAVIVDGNYGLRVIEIPQPIASHFTR